MIGRIVSHYKILEKLGEGGMGVVYRAEDSKLGREVALKFLSEKSLTGEEERARFEREARSAASLNHPNICTIYEIEMHEGIPFIVMELVVGQSLSSLIAEGPLKLEEAMNIAMQAAEGLNEAHEHGIVHRDIKPANIMVTDSGRVKIMDFGLATAADQTRLTREGTTLGTIAYMSPEQAKGEDLDRRSDIWSLGAVLYEMITGQRPFKGDYDQAVLYSIMNEDPDPPTALRTGVPMDLERIALKALGKRRDERYQHADDMLGDLKRVQRAAMAGEDVSSTSFAPAPAHPRIGKPKRRRWIITALAVICMIAAYAILKPVVLEQQLIASPKPVAVIGFENMTGDPEYDYLSRAIPNLLITSLEQSKYLRVTTWERMHDLLDQLGKGDVELIDKETGFELSRMDGIDVIVTGSFVKAGNTFVTDVKVLDVQTKELIKSASARGEGVESILKRQVDELSREIAQGVGLSKRRIEESQRPVEEITTASMEAYNYYLRGVEEYDKFYFDDARMFLERAIEIDSTFAMAHLYLASAFGNLKDLVSRNRTYKQAMRHAERATERERLFIDARYTLVVEQNGVQYIQLLKELVDKYPKEKKAYYWLGVNCAYDRPREAIEYLLKVLSLDPSYAPAFNQIAYCYSETGDYELALEFFERYASASPGDANPFDSMAELYYRMGELEHSIEKYREAIAVKPDFYGSMMNIAYVYGVRGDLDSSLVWMDRYIDTVPTDELRLFGFGLRSMYRFLSGQVKEALADIELWEQKLEAGSGFQTTAQKFLEGNYFMMTGQYEEAERSFEEWKEIQIELFPQYRERAEFWGNGQIALSKALSGRADEALEEMQELETFERVPGVGLGLYSFSILQLIKSEVLLAAGRYEEAIGIARDSLIFEIPRFSNFAQVVIHNFPLDGDVLPRAYIAVGKPKLAVEEYHRLIEFDPESNDRRLRNPLYHYRLGKLYEELGQLAEAAEQYERFLSMWRDADPDRPEYIDAHRRLSELAMN